MEYCTFGDYGTRILSAPSINPGSAVEPPRQTSLFRFGTYEVSLQSGEVRKAGVRIIVQQQPMKVLEVLLERPSEVINRQELRSRVWPNESFGDFDQPVNIAIAKLRSALEDSADKSALYRDSSKTRLTFYCRRDRSRHRFSVESVDRRGYSWDRPWGSGPSRRIDPWSNARSGQPCWIALDLASLLAGWPAQTVHWPEWGMRN